MRQRSFVKMLKSKGPTIDTCGIPIFTFFAVLPREPIFTLYDGYLNNCTLVEGYLHLILKIQILH